MPESLNEVDFLSGSFESSLEGQHRRIYLRDLGFDSLGPSGQIDGLVVGRVKSVLLICMSLCTHVVVVSRYIAPEPKAVNEFTGCCVWGRVPFRMEERGGFAGVIRLAAG